MPAAPLTPEQLADLLEASAEKGAKRALESVGLHDADAGKDIQDLRTLIEGWRGAKHAIGDTFVRWTTTGLLTLLATFLYFKLGVGPRP